MKSSGRTKQDLIEELEALQNHVMELERSGAEWRQVRELLRALFSTSPIGLYIVQDGCFQDVSSEFQQISGYSEKELIGTPSLSLVFPDDRDMVRRNAVKALKGESSSGYEFRVVTRGGETRWVMETVTPVQYYGRPATLGNFMDINERKRTEEELRFSDAAFKSIQESIVATDTEYTITDWNEVSERIYGVNASEAIGKTLFDVIEIIDPSPSEVAEQFRQAESRGYCRCEQLHRTKYTKVWVGLSLQAVEYDGKRHGWVVLASDITERKRAEQELQKAAKLESIGILAGGIAHDFNNILTGIMGNVTLAKRYVEPGDKVFDRLQQAEKACLRARDLTQQLLTFSKGGAPVKSSSSIAELLMESASFALRGSGVRCEFSLSDDLWPVEFDEGQMNQVISNLTINAVEAMLESGVINVRARNAIVEEGSALPLPAGKYVEIVIEDHGVGIPKKNLGKIFDPYFTTKKEGSGLGLATAYTIIKNHNGCVTVTSEVNVGSTFCIYLPASEKSVLPKKEPEIDTRFTGRGRILVMDDEEMIREMLGRILTLAGYKVELASDGAEAVERYINAKEQGQPFSAVILDLTVPGGMGGREAIKKLLEVDPTVKTIVSSGYSNDPIVSDFGKYGFKGVATKPYATTEIEKTLRNVLRGKRGQQSDGGNPPEHKQR